MSRVMSVAMQNLLNGDSVPGLATFWLITRTDGVKFGFTDWTNDIYSGIIKYSAAPGGARSAMQQRVDLATPSVEVTSILESDAVTDKDIRAGKYNNATVKVFMAVPGDTNFLTYGTIILPGAYLGEIKIQDGVYVAELRGLSYALSQSFIEVYTPTCRADFCDARCGLNVANFTVTGTIIDPSPNQVNFFPSCAPPPGPGSTFRFGLCTFTSGRNNGFAVEISGFDNVGGSNQVGLYLPTPYPMDAGGTVSLVAGCDKTIGQCKNFNNIENFRGEPYIPGANFLFDYGEVSP
jgi:uncharacterized phage protein (TIGR02218 family)